MNEQNLLSQIENLKKENKILKFKIDFMNADNWAISNIMNDSSVKAERHILMAGQFTLKKILPLINKWGYDVVNNYIMQLIDKNEEDGTDE